MRRAAEPLARLGPYGETPGEEGLEEHLDLDHLQASRSVGLATRNSKQARAADLGHQGGGAQAAASH